MVQTVAWATGHYRPRSWLCQQTVYDFGLGPCVRAQLDFWGPIPKIPLLCPVRLRSKSGPKTVSPPIQIPIVPNRCADGDPPDIGSRGADLLQPDFRGFGLPTSTELPFYVKLTPNRPTSG